MIREQLSRNFKLSEFACRCGCGQARIDARLVQGLQKLRDRLNRPIHINSGYRCPEHNAEVPGAVKNSLHQFGMAADITVEGMTPAQVANEASFVQEFQDGGIGIYPDRNFVHLDVGRHARWVRNSSNQKFVAHSESK